MHVWNRNGNTSKQVIIHIKEKDTPKLTTKLYKQDILLFMKSVITNKCYFNNSVSSSAGAAVVVLSSKILSLKRLGNETCNFTNRWNTQNSTYNPKHELFQNGEN